MNGMDMPAVTDLNFTPYSAPLKGFSKINTELP